MAPKKRGKKPASTEANSSSSNTSKKKNPAEAILQHKTKQILTDKHCDGLNGKNSEEDECSSNDPMNDDEDEDSSNGDDDLDDVCLHCQSHSLSVQVRCDECSAYICNHCHWCHEFQANHEIRVCDRCDAFYCRACDEMDQCDDCGEVVCGSCSTLLSCKFCGGGLCEECATACGRCGIVLCSRDAKFAVDCDTCRLSYCLVCLASGNKDPCVRCGHRPSKRMEQLVHLRLKSIYKAFKSSTTATGGGTSSSSNNNNSNNHNFSNPATASSHHPNLHDGGGNNNHSTNGSRHISSTNGASSKTRMRENDEPTSVDDLTPGALMLAAAASAAAPSSQLAAAAAAAAAAASVAPNSQLAAAAQAAAGLAVGNGECRPVPPPDTRLNARASAESYEAERIKAEEAAAALIAELDEEEQAVKTKKSKKKKKKERQQAKKAEEQEKKKALPEPPDPMNVIVEKSVAPPKSVAKKANAAANAAAVAKQKKHDAISNHVENTTATTTATATTAGTVSINPTKADAAAVGGVDKTEPAPTTPAVVEPDPLEIEFGNLLEKEDADGLEELLASIKGVPGKAVLRKNVKKALKRMRIEKEEAEDAAALQAMAATTAEATPLVEKQSFSAPATPLAPLPPLVSLNPCPASATPNGTNHILAQHPGMVTPPIVASPRVAELLTIVSQNHNKVSSNSRLPKGHPGTPKSECIMHMAPLIVGWVIGKGGQRIRDLMEESGARIWIDQDSMGPLEPRIVYVSGQRNNVDNAVRMITDLISKAPTETPNSKMSTPGVVMDSHHSNNTAPSLNFSKVPGLPVNLAHGEGSAFQLKPREKKKNGESKAWREMTCDPRFVPLLIGRRGWTIKNIQDSSGARVDIDQNVTPRKITISGSEAAVEIAARMVGDVLSYPHSLLHGTTEDMDIFPPGEAIMNGSGVDVEAIAAATGPPPPPPPDFGDDPVVPVAPVAEHERPNSPIDVQKNRSHHSPPSSLIMTGDGKSTISATSSLSSTPEPSVSTNKAGPVNGQVAPLLPPTFEQQQQHAQRNDMMPASFGFPSSALPQNQNGIHSGLPPQQRDPVGFGLGQPQQPGPPAQHNPGFIPNNHHQTIAPAPLGGHIGGPPPPPLGHGPPTNFEHQQGPQAHAPFPSDPRQQLHQGQSRMRMHQLNGFVSGLHPHATPESHPRSLVNPPMPPPPPPQQSQPQQSAVLPGMWDSGPPPQGQRQPNQARDGFGLEAAVDFLQHSQDSNKAAPPPKSGSVPQSGVGDLMGISGQRASEPPKPGLDTALGVDRRATAPPLLSTNGKDESNIVDSLFGTVSDPRSDAALVSGLRGLSLDPSSNDNDLWGSSGGSAGFDLPPLSSGQQQHLHNASSSIHNSNVMGGHSIFSALEADDRQHSRFSWGE